jgi:hypothetical protein
MTISDTTRGKSRKPDFTEDQIARILALVLYRAQHGEYGFPDMKLDLMSGIAALVNEIARWQDRLPENCPRLEGFYGWNEAWTDAHANSIDHADPKFRRFLDAFFDDGSFDLKAIARKAELEGCEAVHYTLQLVRVGMICCAALIQ